MRLKPKAGYALMHWLLVGWLAMASWGLVAGPGFGQVIKPYQLQLGLGALGMAYVGDLDGRPGTNTPNLGLRVLARLNGERRVFPRLGLAFGAITAQGQPQTAPGVAPNAYVATGYVAIQAEAMARLRRRGALRPQAGLGIGLLVFTPRDAAGQPLPPQAETRLPGEGYGTTTPQLSLAAGLDWAINPWLNLEAEALVWLPVTDYLDNVGQLGTQAGPDWLLGGTLALYASLPTRLGKAKRAPNSPRGN